MSRRIIQWRKLCLWHGLYFLIGIASWILRHGYVRSFWRKQSSVSLRKVSPQSTQALSILFYSPVPSHPVCHGSYARISALRKQLQEAGHHVHFALLESVAVLPSLRERVLGRSKHNSWAAMHAAWDSVHMIPVKHLTFPFVAQVPMDGWYEDSVGLAIKDLCSQLNIDMVICSYVFQSKMFDGLPDSILKVIDTHDRMGHRDAMLKSHQITNTFFSCSIEDEKTYLERADVVLAIRSEEKDYFNALTSKKHALTLSHVPPPRFIDIKVRPLKTLGWVASDIPINFSMLIHFVEHWVALESKYGNVPFQLHLAGNIKHALQRSCSRYIRKLLKQPWIIFHGFIPQIQNFYEKLDLVVAPVHCGTGINIKVVEALSFGMPLYATQCASKGIPTQEQYHHFLTIQALVEALYFAPPNAQELQDLAARSRDLYMDFYQENMRHLHQLCAHPKLLTVHSHESLSLEKQDGSF